MKTSRLTPQVLRISMLKAGTLSATLLALVGVAADRGLVPLPNYIGSLAFLITAVIYLVVSAFVFLLALVLPLSRISSVCLAAGTAASFHIAFFPCSVPSSSRKMNCKSMSKCFTSISCWLLSGGLAAWGLSHIQSRGRSPRNAA